MRYLHRSGLIAALFWLAASAASAVNVVWMEPGSDATGEEEFYNPASAQVAGDTAQFYTGTRSLKFSSGAGSAAATVVTPDGVLTDAGNCTSFRFRFAAMPGANGAGIMSVDTSGGSALNTMGLNTNGVLRSLVAATTVTGTTVLAVDTWYRLTHCFTITNTTTFRFDFLINGVLELTQTTGTLASTGANRVKFGGSGTWGADKDRWYDDVYINDDATYTDPGDVRVVWKKPDAESGTQLFDTAVGNARSSADYNNVNERPLSATNGWQHRAVAWINNGSHITNITTATLAITSPAGTLVGDLLVVAIQVRSSNQDVTPPDGTWTSVAEFNNTANERFSVFTQRASLAGAQTYNFTKPTDDNLLWHGVLVRFAGIPNSGTYLDATAASTSGNASSDTVTYATYDPAETKAYIIAAGAYADDATTAGAMSGTDPTFTNRVDLETNSGDDGSLFLYEGVSSGAATGSRTHSTTSTVDGINAGVQFGIVPTAREKFVIESVSAGEVDITGDTVLGHMTWIYGGTAGGSPITVGIIYDSSEADVTWTGTSTIKSVTVTGSAYPTNVGVRSTGIATVTNLYECGTLIAYIDVAAASRRVIIVS